MLRMNCCEPNAPRQEITASAPSSVRSIRSPPCRTSAATNSAPASSVSSWLGLPERDTAVTRRPAARAALTTRVPTKPVPPNTTSRMLLWACVACALHALRFTFVGSSWKAPCWWPAFKPNLLAFSPCQLVCPLLVVCGRSIFLTRTSPQWRGGLEAETASGI
eukprot:scaffold100613_cov63-Phaeocystis_antarctica.AAC.10